jgi:hypothetical protein
MVMHASNSYFLRGGKLGGSRPAQAKKLAKPHPSTNKLGVVVYAGDIGRRWPRQNLKTLLKKKKNLAQHSGSHLKY